MLRDEAPKPAPPPAFRRALEPPPQQLLAIAVLTFVVGGALLGLFGHTDAIAQVQGRSILVDVIFPERTRHRVPTEIRVEVRNVSERPLELVRVFLPRPYLDAFRAEDLTPDLSRLDGNAYEIDLRDIAAGETRLVTAEVRSQSYGTHRGVVTVVAGEERVSLEVATFVFP
jgi:hypothetical protein